MNKEQLNLSINDRVSLVSEDNEIEKRLEASIRCAAIHSNIVRSNHLALSMKGFTHEQAIWIMQKIII